MDYNDLIERLKKETYWLGGSQPYSHDVHPAICDEAATAITDLLARAEAAESEAERWKNAYNQAALNFQQENRECNKALDDLKAAEARCSTLEKMVKEYQDDLIPGYRERAEKAERERDAAIESIPHECKTCVYHTVIFNGCTPDHDCTNPDGGCSNNYDRWIWRGKKEE